MKSLRIALVLIEPPLPFGHATGRWYYLLLRELVGRGHRVSAFATCSRAGEMDEAAELFPSPDYDLRCYPHPERTGLRAKLETLRRPHSYMFSSQLRHDLERTLRGGYDILHLESLWSGWLGLAHTPRAVINIHNLLEIDLAELVPGSVGDRVRAWRTPRVERFLIRRYPTICTLTPRLSRHVRQISARAEVHTVPLALDLSLYPFEAGGASGRHPVVGLIGSFDWQPSYSAGVRLLSRLWPEIKRRVPDARLQIAGRGARRAFPEHLDLPDAEIHEDVPDPIPYFRGLDVLLYAPARGSGMKVKVLEAFALGVPVVTTPEGVEGIPARNGEHAGIADRDADLVECTVRLLGDAERRRRQARAARRLLETHCNAEVAVDAIEGIYARMTASGK